MMTPPAAPAFSIVVAMDSNRGIGIENRLPWRIPEDMQFFKHITISDSVNGQQNAVIMGRLTYESLPKAFRPLPERHNIVLTRNQAYEVPNSVATASNLDAALAWAIRHRCPHIFVIGGAQIFNDAVLHPQCKQVIVTEVDGLFDCDTFFPEFETLFKSVSVSNWQESSAGSRFRHHIWVH